MIDADLLGSRVRCAVVRGLQPGPRPSAHRDRRAGGAGKNNLLRLMELFRRAIESADNDSRDLRAFLAAFLAARHVGYSSRAVEVLVGARWT